MGGVFSLKFMVSSNLQQGTAVFILFQGKWALSSDLGPQASKTDRLTLTEKTPASYYIEL